MDINKLFKAGMRTCGRVLRLLPTEGDMGIGSPIKYMKSVLMDETLPSLDIVHPMIVKKTISTGQLIPVDVNDSEVFSLAAGNRIASRVINDDRYSTYRIPSSIVDGQEITDIKSCVPVGVNTGSIGGYGDYYNGRPWNSHFRRSASGDLYGAVLAGAVDYADRQLLGSVSRQFRFYFFDPNILMITNYAGPLSIAFNLCNDPSLITLSNTAYEGVRRLFILDLKKSIYNEFGNYTELDTGVGSLDLKIQDWSNAEQERNELYDTYRSTSHFRTSSIRS